MPTLRHPPHEVFAQHYTTNGYNSHAAAAASGLHPYAKNNPLIKARIAEIMQMQFAALQIDALAVKEQLARVAFGDIRNLFDSAGNLRPIHTLDDDTAACIASIDVELRPGTEPDSPPTRVVKIRRHDAMAAVKMLAQHFKVIGEDNDGVNQLANALADRLAAAKRRLLEPSPVEPLPPVEVVEPVPASRDPHASYTDYLPDPPADTQAGDLW